MPLFDNLDLEAVGEAAASLGRYEFLLTAASLPTRGTGSPINPIATFRSVVAAHRERRITA